MWAEACALLERADRLQRESFRPVLARQPTWEPPVDLFESPGELLINAALPGVRVQDLEIVFDGADLIVSGERALPPESEGLELRRLEIPFGRFERRIPLPPGHYHIDQRRLADGCLTVVLRRI
jgi:HSP20 family molecular chaperone IbpA